MKPMSNLSALIPVLITVCLTSCKKDNEEALPIPVVINKIPYAYAGADQIRVLPGNTVTVDASGCFDSDGKIVSYLWKQISGLGPVTITNSTAGLTTITGFAEGDYDFRLQITDNGGAVNEDVLQVKFLSQLKGSTHMFNQLWSSNEGGGADDDLYVTSLSSPDLFGSANVPIQVSLRQDTSVVWISVPKEGSPAAATSKYFYITGSDVLFVYASYPGSYNQLFGRRVWIDVRFL